MKCCSCNCLESFQDFLLMFLKHKEKTANMRERLRQIDERVEVDFDGSTTYRDIEILVSLSETKLNPLFCILSAWQEVISTAMVLSSSATKLSCQELLQVHS